MENKKMTKREMFAELTKVVNGTEVTNKEELLNFIAHEVELLNKKNSRSGKPTKTQVENEEIKTKIFEVLLVSNKPMTVTQLLATEELSGLSNQKVSALLTQLRKDTKVVRTVEKKVAYYSTVTSDEVEEVEE